MPFVGGKPDKELEFGPANRVAVSYHPEAQSLSTQMMRFILSKVYWDQKKQWPCYLYGHLPDRLSGSFDVDTEVGATLEGLGISHIRGSPGHINNTGLGSHACG